MIWTYVLYGIGAFVTAAVVDYAYTTHSDIDVRYKKLTQYVLAAVWPLVAVFALIAYVVTKVRSRTTTAEWWRDIARKKAEEEAKYSEGE